MGGLRARTDQRGGPCDIALWAAIADDLDYRLTMVARALSGDVTNDWKGLAAEALTARDACLAGGVHRAAARPAALADGIAELAEVPLPARPELTAGLVSMVDAFGPVLAGPPGRPAALTRPASPVEPARPSGAGPTVLVVEGAVGLATASGGERPGKGPATPCGRHPTGSAPSPSSGARPSIWCWPTPTWRG